MVSIANTLSFVVQTTVHFWGPLANWGFVLAAMADMKKPPEVSKMTLTSVSSCYVT